MRIQLSQSTYTKTPDKNNIKKIPLGGWLRVSISQLKPLKQTNFQNEWQSADREGREGEKRPNPERWRHGLWGINYISQKTGNWSKQNNKTKSNNESLINPLNGFNNSNNQ